MDLCVVFVRLYVSVYVPSLRVVGYVTLHAFQKVPVVLFDLSVRLGWCVVVKRL